MQSYGEAMYGKGKVGNRMAVRRNTTNRLTLYRTCHTCGKSIVTTADTPFVRQILVDGKQRTCYFCSESCKRASYKYSGWWDGLADARRKAREAARDVREKNRRYYVSHADKERQRAKERYWRDPEAARADSRYQRAKRCLNARCIGGDTERTCETVQSG